MVGGPEVFGIKMGLERAGELMREGSARPWRSVRSGRVTCVGSDAWG